jgi:BolA family transcriptional regulator, general stress-responsive regulator
MPNDANGSSRTARIRALLCAALQTERVDVVDESHLHVGHAGAREGKGHFRVRVVSEQFRGLRPLQRHQLVYRALGEMMRADIHALGVSALTPDEAG